MAKEPGHHRWREWPVPRRTAHWTRAPPVSAQTECQLRVKLYSTQILVPSITVTATHAIEALDRHDRPASYGKTVKYAGRNVGGIQKYANIIGLTGHGSIASGRISGLRLFPLNTAATDIRQGNRRRAGSACAVRSCRSTHETDVMSQQVRGEFGSRPVSRRSLPVVHRRL